MYFGETVLISLIGIGAPSAADRVLAGRLESCLPGASVQCIHAAAEPGSLDLLTARVLEASPEVAAICCTPVNVGLVMDLCRRLEQVLPELEVVLGGPEAAPRKGELEQIAMCIRVVPEGGEVAAHLARAFSHALEPAARPGGAAIWDPYRGRVGDLARAGRGQQALVVEPAWGGDVPVWIHRHVRAAARGQDPSAAAARLTPLLRAGLGTRLADPVLSSHAKHLRRLLSLLEGQGEGLALELPDSVLDRGLESGLLACGVVLVTVELGGLVAGEVDAAELHEGLVRLARAGVHVVSELTYGLPDMKTDDFGRALDLAVGVGVGPLILRRLWAPPGSMPRAAGVTFAPSPPHEVLATPAASAQEVLAMVRLARLFQQICEAFAGTGLLHTLAQQSSLFELLESFADGLAIQGRELTNADEPVAALFSKHLEELGFDLRPQQERGYLRRSRSLTLRWTEGRRVLLDDSSGISAQVGWGAVGLVDRFDRTRPVEEVCEQLVAATPAHRQGKLRRDLHRTVDKLVSLGALVPTRDDGEDTEHDHPVISLDEFDYHYRMLADRARVRAYGRAIQQVVKPGDHVVEIGTGTGILAVLAARAGARVTAIERYSILDMARAVARHSGVEERIDFVRGDADQVQLDRPGDVLLSEIVGNRILNEGLLEATLDARRRLLVPGARLVPGRIDILAQLGYSDRFDHLSREFRQIGDLHEVNLGALTAWFDGFLTSGKLVWEQGPQDMSGFEALSEPVTVIGLDLATIEDVDFKAGAKMRPTREGTANAVVLTFCLTLVPGVLLSSHEQRTDLHWCRPVYMLGQPVSCRPGQTLRAELSYEAHGEIVVNVS